MHKSSFFDITGSKKNLGCLIKQSVKVGILVSLVFISSNLIAQEPTPTPTPTNPNQEELTNIQNQIDLLAKRKELLEARQGLVRAYSPTATSTPLTGEVTVGDSVVLESTVIAYKAMEEISAFLGTKIKNSNINTVIVYNEQDINNLQNLAVAQGQLEELSKGYGHLLAKIKDPSTPEAGAFLLAPEMASAFLRSAADVVSLFRTNVDIKGVTITIEDEAFISQLSNQIQQVTFYYPSRLPPNLLDSADTSPGSLSRTISDIYLNKAVANEIVSNYEAKEKSDQEKDVNRNTILKLKALNAQFDKFITELVGVDDNNSSPLMTLIRAEKLKKVLNNSSTGMLYIKVRAGGENRISQNLFTGTKLRHSGAVIITHMIFDNKGRIISPLTNTSFNFNGYIQLKSRKEKNLANNLTP